MNLPATKLQGIVGKFLKVHCSEAILCFVSDLLSEISQQLLHRIPSLLTAGMKAKENKKPSSDFSIK